MEATPIESAPDSDYFLSSVKPDHQKQIEWEAPSSSPENIPESDYISGWRLHSLTAALFIALFTVQMELTIVSTSIITITNDLKGFVKSSWIFTAYMLTYCCLVIVWAKLSDIYGRKPMILSALFIFTVFSGACGASQTLVQLIVFRCLQGVGGSGVYALITTIIYEMVHPRKYPVYVAILTVAITLSVTFGPLIGGAINESGRWRWIFLINVPLGAIAFVVLFVLQPLVFLNQRHFDQTPVHDWGRFTLRSLRRIDVVGAVLLLTASVFLITSLQEAAEGLSFTSGVVLSLLILSALAWIAFGGWCWFVTETRELPEPMLPWRFLTNRVILGMILNTFFAGTIITVCTIQIPQRFITVNEDSAIKSGEHLLPFSLLGSVGVIASAMVVGRTRIPPIYILFAGGLLEVVGIAGLSVVPSYLNIWPAQYVFQMLAGIGMGSFNGLLVVMTPFAVERRDIGVATAVIVQFRILGGMVLLSIVTSVMNRWIRSQLEHILPAEQVVMLLETTSIISRLPESVQADVREIFGRGYNLQMKIMIGCAVAQLPSTLLMWTKKPLKVQK